MARFFVRCLDCLAVQAVEVEGELPQLTCECGGKVASMGRVQRDRLVQVEHLCPCDDRCTSARGPKCGCKCGGKNHGSNLLVAVTRDAGGIPRISSPNVAQGAEFRAAYEAARQRLVQRWGVRQGWEPESLYWGRQAAYSELRHAAGLKNHKRRMAALAAVGAAREVAQ